MGCFYFEIIWDRCHVWVWIRFFIFFSFLTTLFSFASFSVHIWFVKLASLNDPLCENISSRDENSENVKLMFGKCQRQQNVIRLFVSSYFSSLIFLCVLSVVRLETFAIFEREWRVVNENGMLMRWEPWLCAPNRLLLTWHQWIMILIIRL